MHEIKLVDLTGQYRHLKSEIDAAVAGVMQSGVFIQGPAVHEFEQNLGQSQGAAYVVSCGNGTDALQIALMALDFKPGDEVIVPAFTYVAPAEVIALLGLKPVFADVHPRSFNLDSRSLEKRITKKTRAIIAVHLYGQCAEMEPILDIAEKHGLHVVEDAAQSLGAEYTFSNGTRKKAGTMGVIGCLSFFPTKNLGAFGDGGALFTGDEQLAQRIRMISMHGQRKKYEHALVGVNSRLDTMQAAILNVKLRHLGEFLKKRRASAAYYDERLQGLENIIVPYRAPYSSHTFYLYTIKVQADQREPLIAFLASKSVPSMVYYRRPLHFQEAYQKGYHAGDFPVSEEVARTGLSLPMHSGLTSEQQDYICSTVREYFIRA